MRFPRIILLPLLIWFSASAFALDITTRDGTRYEHCKVERAEPDGLVISHANGVSKVPFEDLPKTLQDQYHYDKETAEAYRKSVAAARLAAKKAAEVARTPARVSTLNPASPGSASNAGTSAASGPLISFLTSRPVYYFVIALVGLVLLRDLWFKTQTPQKKRRRMLLKKYRDPKIVEMILKRTYWTGQTAAQLLDSLGDPVAVDQQVFHAKVKEIWKYNRKGGEYGLRIAVEDGVVVGWDQK